MKKITQAIEYEGQVNPDLQRALSAFFKLRPFSNGLDWQNKLFWAVLEDEDCLAFCIKHPQHSNMFKAI